MRACDPGMMPMYYRFPTALDENPDGYLLVLEILADGSIRKIFSDAGVVDEDLQALGQVSHVDRLVTGLGQRLRHYVQTALQSGNSLRFNWSRWNNLPPVYHEIKVTPDEALSAANVVVSRAYGLHGRTPETSWALQALRQVNDAVIVAEAEQTLGGESRIIYINPSFTVLSGFQLDDLFGKSAKSLFGPENGQHGVSRLRALVGQSGIAERVLSCKDGSKRPVELDIKSITDDAGWLVQWVLVVRGDKSSRSGDHHRVRVVDEAIHGARVGVMITDAETRGNGPNIVYANHELCHLTGYTAAELIGRNPFFLLGSRPEKQAIAGLRQALEQGLFDQQTVRCYHKDGAELWLRWHSLSPVYDDNHRIKNFLILIQDVTPEWTDIDAQIRDAHRDSLGILAAGTAHDLNNILTFICSNSMLAKEDLPAGASMASECLQQIDDAAMSASRLMRQLLNFARAEASVETAVSLPKLLPETVKFSLQGSGVTVKFHIDDECPPVLAADSRLRLAISALAINSREAMPAGGTCTVKLDRVTLAPGALACLLPGNYAQITLTDTGQGIAPEDLSRVFDPYFTTKKSGNGLGLTVARATIEKYGGHLALSSTHGKNTTASIYLPVYAGGMEEAPSTDNEVVHGSGRILLMDDDAKLRERLEKSVRTLGYASCAAQDGAEALELYASAQEAGERFDLVVLDLTVPGGLGAENTLPKLRKLDPSVKVVIASGYNEADVLATISELGFDGLLPKPHTFAELSRVLAGVIGSSSRAAQ
ncbi:MAG: PAS domain-containing protein [Verrucomicrobia bacterium]|nr:PAS domain-containing protein [Verrucomicrobiota bacterium]